MSKKALLFILFFGVLVTLWSYTSDHQAGNGGDLDPKTWHFSPSNKNSFLSTDANVAIKNSEVLSFFDIPSGFTIMLDGSLITSYNWTFLAEPNGISNSNWLLDSYPALENMRIDSTRGRIKSNPGFQFKWAAVNGFALGSATDATHPSLIKFGTFRGAAKEVVAGIIVYFDGTKYVYRTMEMGYQPGTAPSEKENTDDYTGTTGWTISAPLTLTSSHVLCSEIVSDVDESSATTNVVFGFYCRGASVNTGSVYSLQYNVTGFSSEKQLSSTVPQSNTRGDVMTQHIGVAYDGGQDSTYAVYSVKDATTQSKVMVSKDFLPATTPNINFAADAASGSRCKTVSSFYKFRDAFSPDIDCAGSSCYISFIQEMGTVGFCTDTATQKSRIMAFKYTTGGAPIATDATGLNNTGSESFIVPVDASTDPKDELKVVAFSDDNDSAAVIYKITISGTGISQLKIAYYNETEWPRTGFGATGSRIQVTQVSNISDDVPIGQIEPKVGQGNNLYLFWTQGDRSLFPTDPNDPQLGQSARQVATNKFVLLKKWQYKNISPTKELTFDSLIKTRVTTDDLSQFDWSYFKSGHAYTSFIQNNNLYFGHYNGQSFDSSYSILSKGGTIFAKSMTYSKYPLVGSKGGTPASGRTISVWQEDQNIYARAFYDKINLNVKYTFQNWGTVLTPSGNKPTMVRNNYVRPGEKRDVEIFVNDRAPTETVTIWIYDVNGDVVRKIITNQPYDSFSQPVLWDKKNQNDSLVAAGIYHVLIKTSGGFIKSHPIIVVR